VSYLFFNDFCLTNYLSIYQTNLCLNFTVGRTIAVDDQSEISFTIPQGMLPWQPIFVGIDRRWANIGLCYASLNKILLLVCHFVVLFWYILVNYITDTWFMEL